MTEDRDVWAEEQVTKIRELATEDPARCIDLAWDFLHENGYSKMLRMSGFLPTIGAWEKMELPDAALAAAEMGLNAYETGWDLFEPEDHARAKRTMALLEREIASLREKVEPCMSLAFDQDELRASS